MPENGDIEWSSCPGNEPPCIAAHVIRMQQGPPRMAVTCVRDIKSSFDLFIPDSIQKMILDCTNLEEGVFSERSGKRWTKPIFLPTLGFLSLMEFSCPKGNPQKMHMLNLPPKKYVTVGLPSPLHCSNSLKKFTCFWFKIGQAPTCYALSSIRSTTKKAGRHSDCLSKSKSFIKENLAETN